MTAEEIVRVRHADWERLERLVTFGGKKRGHLDAAEIVELSNLYRAACADAARVRGAGADDGTVAYLDGLLSRAHNELYRAPPPKKGTFAAFVARGFPQAVRRNRVFVLVSAAAFFGPFLFGAVAAIVLPRFASSVLGREELEMFRQMYQHVVDQGRSAGGGSVSVSFYIQHNTSIAFQVFANGIFAGLGSLLMLVYQGLDIGTVFGFLIGDEKTRQILTFTCGHSAWELTAIVLAGAGGLKMGWALVETGGRTRLSSLRAAGPELLRLIGGAALMLAVAASIEGLWSPSPVPPLGKYVFAGLQVLIVSNYLTLIGRDANEPLPRSGAFRLFERVGLGPFALAAVRLGELSGRVRFRRRPPEVAT